MSNFRAIPLGMGLPPPERGFCTSDEQYRYLCALVSRLEEMERMLAVGVNQAGNPVSFGIGVELRQFVSSTMRDMAARERAAGYGVIMPGLGVAHDNAVIMWPNVMSDAHYCVSVDNLEALNVATGGPIANVNIKRYWNAVQPIGLFPPVINFSWTVTDAAVGHNGTLIAVGMATEYDNYAVMAAALGGLAPPFNVLLGSGLDIYNYRVGDTN